MKNFTYYEAEKFLDEAAQEQELDIDNFELSEFSNAKEVSKLLDVSESTACNWLAGRTEISKLGEQAIGYQLMLNIVKAYTETPKSNILVQSQDEYNIYTEGDKGMYEFLAKTNNPKLARTIKEIKKVYKALVFCEKFISEELETREDYFSAEELQPYNIELANLRDLISYISSGTSISQKRDNLIDAEIPPIKLGSNNIKSNKDEGIIALTEKASEGLEDKKLYDECIEEGTVFRYKPQRTRDFRYRGIALYVKKIENNKYLTLRVEKDNTIWPDYKNYFGENNVNKTYPSWRSAFEAILYTKSRSLNETEDTEYSTDNEKTWHKTGTLKISPQEYNRRIFNKR